MSQHSLPVEGLSCSVHAGLCASHPLQEQEQEQLHLKSPPHPLCLQNPLSHFLLWASLQSFCSWGWWEALVSARQVGHDLPSCVDGASWGRARGSSIQSQLGLGITRKTSDHFPFPTSHANITLHFNVPYKTIPDIGNT